MRQSFGKLASLAVLLGILSPTASAQQYGQWSWWGNIGANARQYETTYEGAPLSSVNEENLRIVGNVTGFIVDPAIARFEVAADLTLSRNRGAADGSQVGTGFIGRLQLLDRSALPTQIWLTRAQYDYSSLTSDDPLTLVGRPASVNSLGVRMRARYGPLTGLTFGAQQSTNEFKDPGSKAQKFGTGFADWSGGTRVQRHLRLDYSDQDYGDFDYRVRNLLASVDQHGAISKDWNWDLSGNASRQDLKYDALPSLAYDLGQLHNRFVRTGADNQSVQIFYDAGFSRQQGGSLTQSHLARVRLQQPIGRGFSVLPYAGAGIQRAGDVSVLSPQAGIGALWAGTLGSSALTANGTAGYFTSKTSSKGDSRNDSGLAMDGGFSIRHGDESSLHEMLELSISKNQFRSSGEALDGIPGSGDLAGTGTENRETARLTLSRRFGAVHTSLWGDWQSRRAGSIPATNPYSTTVLTTSLQISASRITLQLGSGRTSLETTERQEVQHVGGGLSYRPWRYVAIDGTYRRDTRQIVFGPDVDGDRWEAGASFQLGLLVLHTRMYKSTESAGGRKQGTTGLTVSVDRSFNGWLPIVSAPKRRGVIR